jgi:hypothetical protein
MKQLHIDTYIQEVSDDYKAVIKNDLKPKQVPMQPGVIMTNDDCPERLKLQIPVSRNCIDLEETHGRPGRAGLRSKMYRWRLVTQLCQQPTVTVFFLSLIRPFIGQSQIVIEPETLFHAMDSAIKYDTFSCPCVKCSTCFNGLRACDSSLVLCTCLFSNSSEEQQLCTEKGGGMGDTLNLASKGLSIIIG